MSFHSKKGQRSEDSHAQGHKRARTQEGKHQATKEPRTNRTTPRTPSPSAGTKRSSNDLQAPSDNHPSQAIDSKALYEAHKAEIEHWNDEDFSRKRGIPPGGKALKSNHKWYGKTHAWMKSQRLVQSPKKRRKLNDGTPVSNSAPSQEHRNLKPHQVKYSGDIVPVPEYPLDALEDYTPAPDGRYACSHVHLNPPKECCKVGLTRQGKKCAIKKDVMRWKGRVEKLIDAKKLDKRHITWPDWTVSELRRRYQPELWARQEAKRKADRERKRRENERREMRLEKGREKGRQDYAATKQTVAARPTVVPERPQSCVPNMIPTRVSPVLTPAPQPSAQDPAQRAIASMRRHSDTDTIKRRQNAFLTDLARTNPRLLRNHNALYHDAQYRENLKGHPDFEMLREWYLAYFLQQQRQPLTAGQSALLEGGDPSHEGKKRVGDAPVLQSVDELFGEYLRAARAERARRSQEQSGQPAGSVEAVDERTQQVSQVAETSAVPHDQTAQDETYDFNELLGDTVVTPQGSPVEEPVSRTPVKLLSPDELDGELDRILGLPPSHAAEPVGITTEWPARDPTVLHTEALYLRTLPPLFAIGNQSVDDEMQRLLDHAYQTDVASGTTASEDEQLLHQTIEDSRSDWQRYCDFFSDEQPF